MELMDPLPVEVDAAQVMRTLRNAAGGNSAVRLVGGNQGRRGSSAAWSRLYAQVAEAERHAAIGVMVPALGRFHPIVRPLARLMARGVLYIARFVVTPQRLFNIAVLRIVRSMSDANRDDTARLAEAVARIDKLEKTIVAQAARIESMSCAEESVSVRHGAQRVDAPHRNNTQHHRAAS